MLFFLNEILLWHFFLDRNIDSNEKLFPPLSVCGNDTVTEQSLLSNFRACKANLEHKKIYAFDGLHSTFGFCITKQTFFNFSIAAAMAPTFGYLLEFQVDFKEH